MELLKKSSDNTQLLAKAKTTLKGNLTAMATKKFSGDVTLAQKASFDE